MTAAGTASVDSVLRGMYSEGLAQTTDGSPPFEIFPVGLTERPGRFLAQLVESESAVDTIETGFAYGLSTLWIMSGSTGRHTAVDPDQTKGWRGAGGRAVRDAGLSGRFELVESDSRLALPSMIAAEKTFDFGFIDGAHRFEYVFLDVCNMLRLVRPGGLIVLDDRWMDAVRAAADYAVKNLCASHEPLADREAERRFIALRVPQRGAEPAWDAFERFGPEGFATPEEVDEMS